MRYIAYDTDLNIDEIKTHCPSAKIIKTVKIKNVKLSFRKGLLTIESSMDDEIPAVIWEISEQDLKVLDKKHRNYEKILLVEGFLYVILKNYPIEAPNIMYLRSLVKGYEDFDFDLDILQKAYDETEVKNGKAR